MTMTISQDQKELEATMKKHKITLKQAELSLDIQPLLKLVLGKVFGDLSCLTDVVITMPNAL